MTKIVSHLCSNFSLFACIGNCGHW